MGEFMNYNQKRQFKRVSLQGRIIAHDDQDCMYLECGTISEGGLLIYSKKSLWEPGSTLKLNIKSDAIPSALMAEGTILNYISNDKKGFCLKFSKLRDCDRDLIKNYVDTLTEKEPTKFHLKGTPFSNNFEVYIDGELIPRSTENGWCFDFEENVITFHGKYKLKEGHKVSFVFTDTF